MTEIATSRTRQELPRSVEEMEGLADYYDTHDMSAALDRAERVDPRPMTTTSLRLPSETVAALKAEAGRRGIRYTVLVRQIVEAAVHGSGRVDDLDEIKARLTRIEAAVTTPRPRGGDG